MKQEIFNLIKKKFEDNMRDMHNKLRENRRNIKSLAEEQRRLKITISGFYEILRLVKNELKSEPKLAKLKVPLDFNGDKYIINTYE